MILLVAFGTIILACPVPEWKVRFRSVIIPGWIPTNIILLGLASAAFYAVASSGLNILYYMAIILAGAAIISGSQLKRWLETLRKQEIQEG